MIKLERLTDTAIEPTYGSDRAACFDIYADLEGRTIKIYDDLNCNMEHEESDGFVNLYSGDRMLVPTGFIWHLDSGYELNFLPRSGVALKSGVTVINSPAVIDEDYTEESFVILHNASMETMVINHGDRIAQGKISKVIRCNFESMGEREGGFGSTGV